MANNFDWQKHGLMIYGKKVPCRNGSQFVSIATDKADELILPPVRLSPKTNGFYTVVEGVNVGDRIVAKGSLLLRAEWLKDSSKWAMSDCPGQAALIIEDRKRGQESVNPRNEKLQILEEEALV